MDSLKRTNLLPKEKKLLYLPKDADSLPKEKISCTYPKNQFLQKKTTTTTITAPWHTQLNKFSPKNFFSLKKNFSAKRKIFLCLPPKKIFTIFLKKNFPLKEKILILTQKTTFFMLQEKFLILLLKKILRLFQKKPDFLKENNLL